MKVKTAKIYYIDMTEEQYNSDGWDAKLRPEQWEVRGIRKKVPPSALAISKGRKHSYKNFWRVTFYSERTAIKVWGMINL